MLEPVLPASSALAENEADLSRLVAATELTDGAMAIGRCSSDGHRLDLFRLCCKRGTLERAEAAKPIAMKGLAVVTAMEWLPMASEQPVLCVGFSNGGLSLFTPRGAVCLSFSLVLKPVMRIRLSPAPANDGDQHQMAKQQRVLVLHEGGALAILPLDTLRGAVLGRKSSIEGDGDPGDFRFQLYELRGREATADVCVVDQVLPFEDVFATRGAAGIVALGSKPFVSLHRLSGETGSSQTLLGAAASAFGTYARSWVSFRATRERTFDPRNAALQQPAGLLKAADIHVQPRCKVEELAVGSKFIDPTRSGELLHPAPLRKNAATLGAACDAFGRVSLFCLETLRCLHLWKGYRDAQVAWLQRPCGKDDHIEDCGSGLGLVVYAPRRGLLELWDVASSVGPRRADAAAVDQDCRLLAGRGHVHLLRKNGRLDRVGWRSVLPRAPASGARSVVSGGAAVDAASSKVSNAPSAKAAQPRRGEGSSRVRSSTPGSDDFGSVGSEAEAGEVEKEAEEEAPVGHTEQATNEQDVLAKLRDHFGVQLSARSDEVEELGDSFVATVTARWRDPLVAARIESLKSPGVIEQAAAVVLRAHLQDNAELVRIWSSVDTKQGKSSDRPGDREDGSSGNDRGGAEDDLVDDVEKAVVEGSGGGRGCAGVVGLRDLPEDTLVRLVLTPTEAASSALSKIIDSLQNRGHPLAQAAGADIPVGGTLERLASEQEQLSLYADLLQLVLLYSRQLSHRVPTPASPCDAALLLQSEHLDASEHTAPAPTSRSPADSVENHDKGGQDWFVDYQAWLTRQLEPDGRAASLPASRGSVDGVIDVLMTYEPPALLDPASMPLPSPSEPRPPVLLPFRDFSSSVVSGLSPCALLDFVFQAVLLSPSGFSLATRAARVLRWQSLSGAPWAATNVQLEHGERRAVVDGYASSAVVKDAVGDCDVTSGAAVETVCAERLLQWLCSLPLAMILQGPPMLGAALRLAFWHRPHLVLGAMGRSPPRLLPWFMVVLDKLASAGAAAVPGTMQGGTGSNRMNNGGEEPGSGEPVAMRLCELWPLLAAQLRLWLRLACATCCSFPRATPEKKLDMLFPVATVHRLLFSWPTVLASHAVAAAVIDDDTTTSSDGQFSAVDRRHRFHQRLCVSGEDSDKDRVEAGGGGAERERLTKLGIGCEPIRVLKDLGNIPEPCLAAVAVPESRSWGAAPPPLGALVGEVIFDRASARSGAAAARAPVLLCRRIPVLDGKTVAATETSHGEVGGQATASCDSHARCSLPLPIAVACNCALLLLWRHLSVDGVNQLCSDTSSLCVALKWIATLPSGLTRKALALLAFKSAFLPRVGTWLASAATAPSKTAHNLELDAAITLLEMAVEAVEARSGDTEQQSDDSDWWDAPTSYEAESSAMDTLSFMPASPWDWSSDLASRAVRSAGGGVGGPRLVRLQTPLRQIWLLLRATQEALIGGLAWDLQQLFPGAISALVRDVQLHTNDVAADQKTDRATEPIVGSDDVSGHECATSQEKGLRLEFLLALNAAGRSGPAASLAADCNLREDFSAVLLRRALLRGRDVEVDELLAALRGNAAWSAVVEDIVLEALLHRVAASLQVLCNDAAAQHAMVLCALDPAVLDRFLDFDVDDLTVQFVVTDVVAALRSCTALAAHPLLKAQVVAFQEPLQIAVSLLRAMSADPLGAER
eukprot:TRINITY_DN33015_c0_g1_i1.p1 TRINITY_DN33015_c0_g1~~TRINITY_DN33015_c0_g1_i1.p1  ORF type:complete len:1682 (+),score=281.90 TRINITY_DN33015_c0_g1_i1:91-5136(+)